MRVQDSLPLLDGTSREAGGAKLFEELVVEVGWVNLDVLLCWVLSVYVDVHCLLEELVEAWHVLATEEIARSKDLDGAGLFIVLEAGVSEAPTLKLEVVHLDCLRRVVINHLGVSFAIDCQSLWRSESIALAELFVDTVQTLHASHIFCF